MGKDDRGGRILVVDDDRTFRLSTAELLRQDGHRVDVAADAREAVETMARTPFDLVLLDLRMPGMDGLTALEVMRTRGDAVPVLMISGFGTIDVAVQSLHQGADDFLTKPVDPDVLSAKVAELLERRPTEQSVRAGSLGRMVGRTPAMEEVFDAVQRVAPSEATVLITGDTGTGKELVARAVHDLSPRASKPFVPVNCAALAEGLLESELFGHVRGAFTGAVSPRRGLFSVADGGTIFLDEIGDMSLRLQQRLLRVLQEHEVVPVGSDRSESVDVRVVAATHRDLEEELRAGHFREDLYYRLNVFKVEVPPLRERPGDIPLLVEAALDRVRDRSKERNRPTVSPLAMRMLRRYEWPGNVRELFAMVESAAVRSGGGRIEAQHLPANIREYQAGEGPQLDAPRYQPTEPDAEREAIRTALAEAGGSKARAAELLGMSRTTLWRRLREYRLGDQ
jgi:two-component system response regulator HydG